MVHRDARVYPTLGERADEGGFVPTLIIIGSFAKRTRPLTL